MASWFVDIELVLQETVDVRHDGETVSELAQHAEQFLEFTQRESERLENDER